VHVRAACYVSYAAVDADVLDGSQEQAVRRTLSGAQVRLRIPDEAYSRFIGPSPPPGERHLETPFARLRFEDGGRVHIQIEHDPGDQSVVAVWRGGRLQPLF